MTEKTAKSTVLSNLKRIGLLEKDGKPSDLARRWRDDEEYPTVCQEILEAAYPQALRDAVPDPVNDIENAKRWFANRTGGGESAARKTAHTYKLVAEADLSKAPDATKAVNGGKATARKFTPSDKAARSASAKAVGEAPVTKPTIVPRESSVSAWTSAPVSNLPLAATPPVALHFHFPSDATAEYIDTVLGVVTKHLGGKSDVIIAPTAAA